MNHIKMIKFYQGVLLGNATLTSFTPDEYQSDKLQAKGYKAEIVEMGVRVSGPEMTCLVPWNNVAYVQLVKGLEMGKVSKPK